MKLSAVISAAALCAALVTGCSAATNDASANGSAVETVTPSTSSTYRYHVAIPNDIDPRDLVTKADAVKLIGTSLPRIDVLNDDRHDKWFPSNSRKVWYSNRKDKDLLVTDDYLKVTTKVIDKTFNRDGYKDGSDDVDVNAYGSSSMQTVSLTPDEVGLNDSSSVQVFLLVHGIVDANNYYPNPTQHDIDYPYGVYIWGDQKLANGKTRPVRLTISTEGGSSVNHKGLLALATKAVARMNLK